MSKIGRRAFLKTTGAAGAAAGAWQIVPRHVLGAGLVPPSEKLNVASIGVGGQGRGDFGRIAKTPDVNMVGICDVDPRQTNALQRERDEAVRESAQKCKVF